MGSMGILPENSRTVLVCHSNKTLARLAQLQSSRLGVAVAVVIDPKNVVVRALGDPRPDAIILSNDLKNPSTDEILRALNGDPRLKGVRVIVMKGMLDGLAKMLKGIAPLARG